MGGSGNAGISVEIGSLKLALPPDYVLAEETTREIASPIPGLAPTRELFFALRTDGGETLYVFCWLGDQPRDLGPMAESRAWPVQVLGHETKIVQTDIFMGSEQRVLAAFLSISRSERTMFYSPDLSLEEFAGALSALAARG